MKSVFLTCFNIRKLVSHLTLECLTMPSVSRNSPCPCGSGKKYKRCCNDKPVLTPSLMREAFDVHARKQDADARAAFQVLQKYNSADVFKVLSFLNLQPTNHGKN